MPSICSHRAIRNANHRSPLGLLTALFVRGLLRELGQLEVLYHQSELNGDGLVREVKADNLPEGKNHLINSNRVNQQPPSKGRYFFMVGRGQYYLISVLGGY